MPSKLCKKCLAGILLATARHEQEFEVCLACTKNLVDWPTLEARAWREVLYGE